ncbi:hypothetical protein [Anaeromicropila herbilytica]|uniref:Uncharacterized protein n=1 Tax=Anaeromicropila herbilytica TaxID=2785025 RepID=A0A7R7EKZ1_9FIRM|nr:hypothetical protein [Anaeromicropila herbilytica]BCN30806.1 hypothetical protein bsdtb5_21010 [Anaeromicropila herbilytica]
MYYHGSSEKGLEILLPHVSEHEEPYIYFSTNSVVASFYMVHVVERPFNWFPYGFSQAGIPIYTEYYPDALADVYSGKTGYLYECSMIDVLHNPTNINCAITYPKPVPIEKCTVFTDIYKILLEYEKQGELIIQRYDTLDTKMISFIYRTIQSEIKDNSLKDSPDLSYSVFLKSRFPDIRDSV